MNHKALYDRFSFRTSKSMTLMYSTSFSLGIQMLDKRFHGPIYGIYGLVRAADEIVDTFHDYDKRDLLDRFKADTWRAIDDGISLNPVLNAFQQVVRDYGIERDLIDAFFHSMEMDLYDISYDTDKYHEYIYGSAEVVGLMCLRVFAEGDQALFDDLRSGARFLGAAFQKVNFLRDVQADYEERGRTYFPGVDFIHFNEQDKQAIEEDIARDFERALVAIRKLPSSSRLGVYLAYEYYLKLFGKIRAAKAEQITTARFRVSDVRKLTLLARVYLQGLFRLV